MIDKIATTTPTLHKKRKYISNYKINKHNDNLSGDCISLYDDDGDDDKEFGINTNKHLFDNATYFDNDKYLSIQSRQRRQKCEQDLDFDEWEEELKDEYKDD